VSHLLTEVEITCLPGNLPEYIEIDLVDFNEGDIVRLSEIKLPKGVVLTAFTHGDIESHDATVVATTHVQAETETVEDDTVETEVTSTEDVKSEESSED
jgi:large subunit ribosomal protein L25